MKKMYILSLSLVITAGLLTACGDKKEVEVSAMENNIVIETETNSETETTTEIETETESETETETESISESTSVQEEITESIEDKAGDAEENTYTVTDLDETMYATTDAYTYDGPSTEEYKIKATVQKDEQVKVVGKVEKAGWYEIEQEGEIRSFISADLLTSTAPVSAQDQAPAQDQDQDQAQDQAQVSTPQTSQNTEPQQQTQTPQQVQETPQSEIPVQKDELGRIIYSVKTTPPVLIDGEWRSPDGVALINPATGDYYQPGDVMPDGKTVFTGIFNHDDTW